MKPDARPNPAFLILRATSSTAFALEALAVVATLGAYGWAPDLRLGLGWRFWMRLGGCSACLAVGCLVGCAILCWVLPPDERRRPPGLGRLALLDVATIGLSFFVPAVSGL